MSTHNDEQIVVMAEEVLTLEPLSPVRNRDDGRAPAPVPGLYDEPRRDILRRDGRGCGRAGCRCGRGRGRGGGRGGGRAAARREAEMVGMSYDDLGLEERMEMQKRLSYDDLGLEERMEMQKRRICAFAAAKKARERRMEPISLSPVEREPTEVSVRLTVDLPFQWVKKDFKKHLCPITLGLKESIHRNKLKNLEHLHEKFISGEWASKSGVTYTHEDAGCIPTKEEMCSLTLRGLELKGKIVYENGALMDTDKSNEIEKVWSGFVNAGLNDLATDLKNIPALLQARSLFKKQKEHIDFYLEMCRRTERLVAPERMRVDEPGIFDQVKTMVGMDFHPPAGEYEQIPKNSSWTSFGIKNVVMCDNPDCCRMSMFTHRICNAVEMQLNVNGHDQRPNLPINAVYGQIGGLQFCRGSYEVMTDFLHDRLMYRKKDEINGDFDICYHCLHKKAHPVD